MKVLFIGGTGKISSACSPLAVERGIDLYLLNRGQTDRPLPEGAHLLHGDIRDKASVRAAAPDDTALLALSQELIDIILAVLAPYGLSEEHALHAIRGLRSVAHGFATIETAGGFGMALDRDESFLRLVQGLIAGIKQVEK